MRSSMMAAAAAAAALLLAGSCLADFSWEPCDRDQVPFIPDTVTLTPDPPIIGGDVDFNIVGSADRGVAAGSLAILVFFADTQIYEENDDLCGKTSCPIAPGVINIHYTQPLPPIAPPGDYMVHVIAYDDQHTELMCVAVNFTLTLPEMAAAGGAGAGAGGAVERARAAFADVRQLVAAGGKRQPEQEVEKVVRRRRLI